MTRYLNKWYTYPTLISLFVVPEVAMAQEVQNDDDFIAFEEIVVTARKRAESMQDIPVAVSAISGRELEVKGLENAEDLFSLAPGLFYSQRGQRNNDEQFYLTIRGVGSSPVVEPSVGVFVDGVYMPSLGWSSEFLDVERVEVLRGPQGSLFGRNTLAGALNIVSKTPSDEFASKITAEGADFGTFKGAASISGPLSDIVSASISAFATTTNGYINNVARSEDQDNRDTFGGRLKIAIDTSDDSSLIFVADYRSSEGRFNALGDASTGITFDVVDPNAPATGTFTEAHPLAGPRYTTFETAEQIIDVESYGLGLTFDYDFGPVSMTSITGYRFVESVDLYGIDGIDALATNDAVTKQEILSEELRFSSNSDGPFSYIAGVYLFSEKLIQNRTLDAVPNTTAGGSNLLVNIIGGGFPATVLDNVQIDREGIAFFGQASYAISDKVDLTAGLRYSYESVDQAPDLFVNIINGAVSARNTTVNSDSFDGLSPMASINYDINDDTMAYFSVATGFKGGGFTKEIPNTPDQNATLENETSISYEAGLKSVLFDGKVQLNTAVFRTDIKEMQLSTRINIGTPTDPIFIPSTANAGKARTQGVELEFVARPTPRFQIQGSLAYIDSEFLEYVQVPSDGATIEYSRAGQQLPEVPEWTGSVSAQYSMSVSDSLEITPSVTYRYVGSKFIGDGTDAAPFLNMSSYDVVDAQVSMAFDDWTLIAYARNLFDSYYIVNQQMNQAVLSVPGRRAFSKPGAPRQVGVRAIFEFY